MEWSKAFQVMWDYSSYDRPWALWLFTIIPMFFLIAWFKRNYSTQTFKVSGLAAASKNILYWVWKPLMYSCVWVFLVVALANPTDRNSWEVQKTLGIDMVVALDVSTSMLARDFQPNRLGAAKKIASEFVLERPFDRFGLVVFAGESFTQCPITVDHKRLAELFGQVRTGLLEDGTAIGEGLATSIKRLKDSEAESKVIVLLTDGENNSGEIAPEVAAKLAKQFGIKVYTIGVGKEGEAEMPYAQDFKGNLIFRKVPVKIDETLLKKIAGITGGKYYRATGNQQLKEIYTAIDALEKTELESTKYSTKTSYYLPFVLLTILGMLFIWLLENSVFKKL